MYFTHNKQKTFKEERTKIMYKVSDSELSGQQAMDTNVLYVIIICIIA
jgi:hypothetical protein